MRSLSALGRARGVWSNWRAWVLGACVIACLLAIFGISVRSQRPNYRVIVLDLSRSHGGSPTSIVTALGFESPKQGQDEKVAILGFGMGPVQLLSGFKPNFESAHAAALDALKRLPATSERNSGLLEVSEALSHLLARAPLWARRDIRIFGDGRWTDAAMSQARRKLLRWNPAWEFAGRLVLEPEDLRVRLAGAVPKLRAGERVVLQIAVEGTTHEDRSCVLSDGVTELSFSKAAGQAVVVSFPITAPSTASKVSVTLRDAGGPDLSVENNSLTLPLSASPSLKLAVVGEVNPAFDQALGALRESGVVEAQLVGKGMGLPFDAQVVVMLNAQPTSELLEEINRAVRERGCGLLMFGGDRAFRSGGYAGTRLEALSPLSSAPPEGREIHILLDRSGSMERDRRLARSTEAIARLGKALSQKDLLQVHGFTAKVHAPVPIKPASPAAFTVAALPELRRWVAQGGTQMREVLPRVRQVSNKRDADLDLLFVLVGDLQDEALDDSSFIQAINQELAAAHAQAVILLLDPDAQSIRRAESLDARWFPVVTLDQEFLLRAVEEDGFVNTPVTAETEAFVRQFSVPGEMLKSPWSHWNPTSAGEGAQVQLRAKGNKAPLVAEAQRGGGKVMAVATDAGLLPGLNAVLGAWLKRLARREETAVSASLEGGQLWVELAEESDGAPMLMMERAGRLLAWDEVRPLRFRAPLALEQFQGKLPRHHLSLLRGEDGRVQVPLAHLGDSEFWIPARAHEGKSAPTEVSNSHGSGQRLRWPFVLLALVFAALAFVWPNSRPQKS